MNDSRFPRKRLMLVVLVLAAGLWGLPRLSSEWQLDRCQQDLFRAIEQRDTRTAWGLVSEEYADHWNFDAAAIRLAMDDVAAQFLTLKITPGSASWVRSGKTATHQAVLQLSGKSIGPLGPAILQRATELKAPFEFTWRKEAVWPWSWRLVRVAQPEVEVGEGYTPGMFSGH